MTFFYKQSKSKKKIFLGGGGGGEAVDRQTDEQAQTDLPFNFFKVGGITMNKCTNNGPDKLNI